MKKLINSFFVTFLATATFAQEIHDAKIIGSFELGNNEITTIYDEVTGCERKTSPHSKNLFTPNENVQIKISENRQMAEVIKPTLPEQVYTNKNCINGQQECSLPLCVLNNNEKSLQLKYSKNGYKVFYNASKSSNNSIKSSLIIYGGNNGNRAISTSYFLDKTDESSYKLISHRDIIKEATKLSKINNIQISDTEVQLVESLVSEIKNTENELVQSELAKSIYFNIAIIKTAKRSIENNNSECNCTTVPFYFTDKTPFLCQEDLMYDLSLSISNLKNNLVELSENYNDNLIEELNVYLNQKILEKEFIGFKEFFKDFEGVNPDTPLELVPCIGSGSMPGCCGNYSGCCYYASIHCLMHDLICWNCDAWHCGWGCQPG